MTSTLLQIRQFDAVKLGGDSVGGFLASTATNGTVGTLVDANWPLNTTLSVSEMYQDAWVLRPAAIATDKVRIVATYTPVGGVLTPDLAWTNAPTNGEAYELHTVMEPQTSVLKCINLGLKRCFIETELACTPVTGSSQHSLLTVAPWLTNRSWVRQVGFLSTTEDRNKVDPYERVVRGEARNFQGQVVISHPGQTFSTSTVLYIRCMVPAYYACTNAGGTPQNGLSADTDIAPVRLELAAWASLVEAWQNYGQSLDTAARERTLPTRAEAAAEFTTWVRNEGRWPTLTFRPLLAGGPIRASSGGMPIAYRATTA